jgi:hypothetical protein
VRFRAYVRRAWYVQEFNKDCREGLKWMYDYVHQGCVMSLWLFKIFIDVVVRKENLREIERRVALMTDCDGE